jgi:hypothetical protein
VAAKIYQFKRRRLPGGVEPMSELPLTKKCSTCEFWIELEGEYEELRIGFCTINPPVYKRSDDEEFGTEVNSWPITTSNMSCGAYRRDHDADEEDEEEAPG